MSAFRPAIAHYGEVQAFCKENATKFFQEYTGAHRVGRILRYSRVDGP
jgi:hypothetical protein